MRADARPPDALRPVSFQLGYQRFAEGSVLIEVGNTRVLCSASAEDRVPAFRKGTGEGWVTAEYSLLPRSTLVRSPRESVRGRVSGRTHEIQRAIGRALRAVTELPALGERTIWLDCDVLQADGGTRTAATTGSCVALALALRRLRRDGHIESDRLRGLVAAVSAGVVAGEALLDLDYREDFAAEVDLNVAKTDGGLYVDIGGAAESQPFDSSRLDELLGLAGKGISELHELQRRALEE